MPGDTDVRTTHLFRGTRRWTFIGWLVMLPLPTRAQSAAWPEFPQPDPPPVSTIPQRPPHLPAPSTAGADSLQSLESIQRASQPAHRLAPNLTMIPAPPATRPKAQVSTPPSTPPSVATGSPSPQVAANRPTSNSGLMPERAPKDFGQGWKQVITRGPAERDRPAASLATPSNAPPRPAWGWHGYESYQRDGSESRSGGEWAKDLSAELAPFMKYAHRWRPSSVNTAFGPTPSGYAAPGAPVVPPVAYTAPKPTSMNPMPATSIGRQATPAVTLPVDGRGIPMSAPSPSPAPAAVSPAAGAASNTFAAMPIPAVTVPVDSTGRPMIQQTSYRTGEPTSVAPKKYVVPLHDLAGKDSLPAPVQEKIAATCAGKCRGLVVQNLGAGRLLIRFSAKDQLDAELLTNLLSSLPELAPYRVEFEVQIGQ